MSTAIHEKTAARADFGDVKGEFRSLASGCGVYDRSGFALFAVAGKDRTRWLNGMITNNIRDLPPGQGVYAFILNPQGHILGDLYAYNRGESLLLELDRTQAEPVLTILRRYIIMDKVEIADASQQLAGIGLAGPKSAEVLHAAGLEFADLGPLQLAEQAGLTIARGDNPARDSYQLWLEPSKMPETWSKLTQAGGAPTGSSALELFRVACGIPRHGLDIRERDLPQETGQERALSFVKGCYIGQEIVERIRSRGSVHRRFSGFAVSGPLPAPGTPIQFEGKNVGEVTSAASLPVKDGEYPVALGYVRREAADKALDAGTSRLSVTEIPFAQALEA